MAEVIPMPALAAPEPTLNVDASVHAPVIYSDYIGSHGLRDGVGFITLEACRFNFVRDGVRADDRVAVAHLKIPLHTLDVLISAIQTVKEMERNARAAAQAATTIIPPGGLPA